MKTKKVSSNLPPSVVSDLQIGIQRAYNGSHGSTLVVSNNAAYRRLKKWEFFADTPLGSLAILVPLLLLFIASMFYISEILEASAAWKLALSVLVLLVVFVGGMLGVKHFDSKFGDAVDLELYNLYKRMESAVDRIHLHNAFEPDIGYGDFDAELLRRARETVRKINETQGSVEMPKIKGRKGSDSELRKYLNDLIDVISVLDPMKIDRVIMGMFDDPDLLYSARAKVLQEQLFGNPDWTVESHLSRRHMPAPGPVGF